MQKKYTDKIVPTVILMSIISFVYPIYIIYSICFFFFPKICSGILLMGVLLYWLYIFIITKNINFRDNNFSEREKEILYKYPLHFRYINFSVSMSKIFAFVQITIIFFAIFLIWKMMWVYLIPVMITFFVCTKLRVQLDPLIFRNAEYDKYYNKVMNQNFWDKRNKIHDKICDEAYEEINLIKKVYEKLYNN